MCKLFPLIQCMSICISTLTLTSIAIDRYILICHPTRRPIKRNGAIGIIVIIWEIAGSLGIPMMVHGSVTTVLGLCETFCQEVWKSRLDQTIYGLSVLILQFVLPFLIMGYCYSKIFLALGARMEPGASGSVRRVSVALKRQRTNKMLIAMCLIFVSCWSLQVLSNLLFDLDSLPQFILNQHFFFSLVTHSVAMTTVFWNPLLYAWLNENFRRAFFELMPFLSKILRSSAENNVESEGEMQLLLTQRNTTGKADSCTRSSPIRQRHTDPIAAAVISDVPL